MWLMMFLYWMVTMMLINKTWQMPFHLMSFGIKLSPSVLFSCRMRPNPWGRVASCYRLEASLTLLRSHFFFVRYYSVFYINNYKMSQCFRLKHKNTKTKSSFFNQIGWKLCSCMVVFTFLFILLKYCII